MLIVLYEVIKTVYYMFIKELYFINFFLKNFFFYTLSQKYSSESFWRTKAIIFNNRKQYVQ